MYVSALSAKPYMGFLLLFFPIAQEQVQMQEILPRTDRIRGGSKGSKEWGKDKGGHRMTGVKDMGGKKSLFQSGVVEQG